MPNSLEEYESDAAPRLDSADFLKPVYNCMFRLWANNTKLTDDAEVHIIGSGRYIGADTMNWADEATKKLLYFSYRNRFPPLANGATTDLFWGCMIRTGQMMLAHAYMRYFNGGEPHMGGEKVDELRRRTQALFCDVPSAPFGIHAVTAEGTRHGVACGEWFGPTLIALTLSGLSAAHRGGGGDGPAVLALPGREVHEGVVAAALQRAGHVVLLVPVMLGLRVISAKYAEFVRRCLEMESSVGILGGRSRSALFLFGHQGEDVFFLDPHCVQRAFTSPDRPGELTCARRVLPITSYDPCMTLGFYISSLESFEVFKEDMARTNADLTFPLISVSSGMPPSTDVDIELDSNFSSAAEQNKEKKKQTCKEVSEWEIK